MQKQISVIIVTYNSEQHIYNCLDSIFQYNDIGDELEIIIVDNMSKDVDVMFQRIEGKYGKDVKLIRNTKNGGYGQGNNIGIKVSTGEIILIMNPDVRLLQPIFKEAINHFQNQRTVMLGMLQMISETKRGWSFMPKFSQYPIFEIFESYLRNKFLCYNYKRMYFSGSCFFIRKSDFEDIGLFNENVFLYGEENYLHYRMRKLKPEMKFVFDENMKYLHLTDERMPAINSTIQTIDSIVEYYIEKGVDRNKAVRNQIKYEIKRSIFFKYLRWLKKDYKFVEYYTELISVLENKLKDPSL